MSTTLISQHVQMPQKGSRLTEEDIILPRPSNLTRDPQEVSNKTKSQSKDLKEILILEIGT